MLNNILNFNVDNRDFPYYNKNPHISKGGWLILLLSALIAYFVYIRLLDYSKIVSGIAFCLIMLIPLLYLSNWDYDLIFHKPNMKEILLAILLFIGYMAYVMIINSLVGGFSANASSAAVNWDLLVSFIFTLMGEELFKFIPLMFFMRFFYKFSNNRKISLAFASILVLLLFALLHFEGSILSVIIFQGIGSIFELVGYLKTKNLFVSYLTHLLTDVFLTILPLIHF